MATFLPNVTVHVTSCADAAKRVKAYRTLYNTTSELLTYVMGTFLTINDKELVFLNSHAGLVDVYPSRLKWYDRDNDTWISIIPADPTFELTIRK